MHCDTASIMLESQSIHKTKRKILHNGKWLNDVTIRAEMQCVHIQCDLQYDDRVVVVDPVIVWK